MWCLREHHIDNNFERLSERVGLEKKKISNHIELNDVLPVPITSY